jgi:hypothetical protein
MKKIFLFFGFVALSAVIISSGCFNNNVAPAVPSAPSGPTSGAGGVSYDFIASTTDADGDNIAYQFTWGTSDTSSWSSFIASGTQITMSHAWSANGTYSVTVRAKDAHDKMSDWSTAHQIMITNAPITPPMPGGPNSGFIDSVYTFTSVTTDPDNDSIAYRFDWGDGDTSSWSLYYASGATASMTHAYTTAGSYALRVQAKDPGGSTSTWSTALSITIAALPDRITLTWGAEPHDLDAHFWTPVIQGQTWHIYSANPGHINNAPYCSLDVDCTNGYGPEQITISQVFPGTYKYGVYHYDGDSTITTSHAVVRVYHQNQLLQTFNVPTVISQPNWWWHVFNLDGATGIITPVNTVGPNPPSYVEKMPAKK